jgi:hypothetical protein
MRMHTYMGGPAPERDYENEAISADSLPKRFLFFS